MSVPNEVPPRCEFNLDQLKLKFEVIVPSDVQQIDDVVAKIIVLINATACHEGLERIDLALHEALANAIIHGNRNSPEKAVRVCVAVQKDCGILIVVKDLGTGFDPATLPNPVIGQNLLGPHGRGVYLIHQLMDDVTFHFDKGTEIWLRRTAAPENGQAAQ